MGQSLQHRYNEHVEVVSARLPMAASLYGGVAAPRLHAQSNELCTDHVLHDGCFAAVWPGPNEGCPPTFRLEVAKPSRLKSWYVMVCHGHE
jgi:hypothetical protein